MSLAKLAIRKRHSIQTYGKLEGVACEAALL